MFQSLEVDGSFTSLLFGEMIPVIRRRHSRAASVVAEPMQFIESLESRVLLAFTNWSAIGPAIAKVPLTAGQLASVSVVNFGSTVYTGPLNTKNTLDRIRANNGPDRTDDGIVFNNSTGQLPTGHGTWYEFTVEPKTGTDHNFTTVASPGPMRILLAADGDTYFTGDHYVTFKLVYDPTVAAPTPKIGTFTLSPTSVTAGSAFTLTAASVTETGGTIAGVNFYRDTNGVAGLQVGSDTLVGAATASGTTWTLGGSTTGLATGSYTYYAVAADTKGVSSTALSAALTITTPVTPKPTIGSFTISPTSVTIGGSATLTASGVTETGGTISSVNFYRESNATAGLQTTGDTLIGTGTQSGTTWTISTSTTGLAAGTYTYYAVATDAASASNAASSATLGVTNPVTSGTLLNWTVAGQTNFGTQGLTATTIASGVTNSLHLTRGSGVTTTGTAATSAWGGAGWASTSAAGISSNATVTFGVTAAAGTTLSLNAIDLNYRRSSTGAASGYWQYQINSGTWNLVGDFANEFSSTSSSGAAISEISLAGISALHGLAAGTAVNFRLVPYGASSTGGTWYIYDINGKDLVLNGSTSASALVATAAPAPAVTPQVVSFSSWFDSTVGSENDLLA